MGGRGDYHNILYSVEKYDVERDVWVELEVEGTSFKCS